MAIIHFLNVLEGDCNIIQHDSQRVTVMDVSNAYNQEDTPQEKAVKDSRQREEIRTRTRVPSNKVDYKQKLSPDNPIDYLRENVKTRDIFRFIISHPDMDHMDGIKDLFTEFLIYNAWDTDNNKTIKQDTPFAGYNPDDWSFYTQLRAGQYANTRRLTYYDETAPCEFWDQDGIQILCPSKELVQRANASGDYNDASYVLLYKVPKQGGGHWKFVFAGDSDDHSWDHIIERYSADVSNIDVLFAPHHGRDSNRKYDFLKTLNPRVTLLGNASSKHLAYSCYPGPPKIRITNNQAGYVVIDASATAMTFYVKNYDFARDFKGKRGWAQPVFHAGFKAYALFKLDA